MEIPVEETVGVISELVKEGYVKKIGLSQVDENILNRAEKIHHISYVESNYSLFNREIEKSLIPAARKNKTEIIAFGVLAHGLLTEKAAEIQHYNNRISLFKEGNLQKNLVLVEKLQAIANKKGVTLPTLAVAWILSKGNDIIPIIGMTKPEQLDIFHKAANLKLDEYEIEQIEAAIPEEKIHGEAFPKVEIRNGKAVFL